MDEQSTVVDIPKKPRFGIPHIHITIGDGLRQFLIIFFSVLFSMAVALVAIYLISEAETNPEDPYAEPYSEGGLFGEGCNVMAIALRDCLTTYTTGVEGEAESQGCYALTSSESVATMIEEANKDSHIDAILLDVDSYGGSPVAGEEMARAVKASEKPVVAWVRSGAASAAYWAISPADVIVASKNSDIGSIGVTASYLDNAQLNEDSGYTYNQLSTGVFKDLGNPDKPLTDDERTLIKKQLNIILDNFIGDVSQNRNVPEATVRELADGSTMLGEEALSFKLIDVIGGKKEAYAKLQELIHHEPVVCGPY
jgi:protease-4